ncbi:hypothetical protein BBD42_15495 [Paenibacillus sp. BIHB 4019]|uniref:Uncharacterized protein n=1 Tax=Paenibacillus sp. BIHB 4019 TaxID=1870819 RepID=A0A1B2DJ15_9BACL|nr:hypothetical protein [Paenibacillus sp. BIHB 4019]ANY67712.1 hypothetical protein BBD42_15495 [Paenibacillus sp. BIHB 4019]
MAQLNGITAVSDNEIIYEGLTYKAHSGAVQAGDIARWDGIDYSAKPAGAYFRIIELDSDDDGIFTDSEADVDYISTHDADWTIFRLATTTAQLLDAKRKAVETLTEEISQLEAKLSEENTLKVGDYARFVSGDEYAVGTIVVVNLIDELEPHWPYGVRSILATNECRPEDSVKRAQIERLTPAEARAALLTQIDELIPSESL